MTTKILIILTAILISSCSVQEKPQAVLIFDSNVNNLHASAIKKIDPGFFTGDYYWIVYQENSFWGTEKNGIKYKYNYEDSTLTYVNGTYPADRIAAITADYGGNYTHGFYFDNTIIGWLTRSEDRKMETLRITDFEKKTAVEITFHVPDELREISPVIIDTTRLLYKTVILNSNEIIDTLKTGEGTVYPYDGDKVFMRKNSYMIDSYHEQENPNINPGYNAFSFNRITDGRLITQNINSDDPNLKIQNYRIESSHENIWLLSHKIHPEKFLLYDVNTNRSYPFELDKNIFNLSNLQLDEPIVSTETVPTQDVKFSYWTSMNENNIYIYLMKDGIRLYKVPGYKKLIQ